MKIGVPKEIKIEEYRVGLKPSDVVKYVTHGYKVYIETKAGANIDFLDKDYEHAGAQILQTAEEVFDVADMIIKVKEPQPCEVKMLHKGQILFTYLHLAANETLTRSLLKKSVVCIAYETIEHQGKLPLLDPMSEIAGSASISEGQEQLKLSNGGSGVLFGGVARTDRGNIVIIGAGVSGKAACRKAIGTGANVTVLDIDPQKLDRIEDLFPRAKVLNSTKQNIREEIAQADLVVCAVLIEGAETPILITKEDLKLMKPNSVIVDISIDQGGCVEGVHPTTHKNPTFRVNGINLYCVANIPGVFARTATKALTNATLEYGLKIADLGIIEIIKKHPTITKGINIFGRHCTYKAVAETFGLKYTKL